MIWIIVTDLNQCRIYSYQQKPISLKLEKEIIHPEIRFKKSEFLTTDRPGHYQTKTTAKGAYSPRTDPKETQLIFFAQEIAEVMHQGRIKNKYDKLILIAGPHMNGVIVKQLDKHVKNLIVHNIKKDYLHLAKKDLLSLIKNWLIKKP